MEIIKEIGAYTGFAAVVGLAVLAALYFSQARDVKRLREWAGRAPERGPTAGTSPAAAQAQPVQQQAGAQKAVQPRTVGPAVPQQKPATAAKPGQAPATPGQPVRPGPPAVPGKPAVAGAGAATAGGAATPAGAASAGAPPKTPADKDEPATDVKEPAPTGAGSNGEAPAPPAVPRPIARRTVPAPTTATTLRTSAPTSVMKTASGAPPPRKKEKRGGRNWPAPRYLAIMIAGLLVIGGGAVYGVGQLVSQEDQPAKKPADGAAADKKAGDAATPAKKGVNPSTVTVAVLNGTTVPGLAATVADSLEQARFQRGNVTNSTNQQRAESVVQFNPSGGADAQAEADAVAKKLKISQVSEVDAESQQLAGNASVIVIVGQDRAN